MGVPLYSSCVLFGSLVLFFFYILFLPIKKKKIVDCFKVLLLYFVITRLVVLVDIYVLIYWQFDEMFGNYMFSI